MSADRSSRPGTARFQPFLFAYALVVWLSLVFLLLAGAMVTSTGSGMAVPDWPLSFGKVMPPMEGGVFYEHGHRMVAAGVGVLMIGLAFLLWRKEPRSWLRKLGWTALGLVVAQGLLGGITVLLGSPETGTLDPTSIVHGCLAQAIFLVVTFIALGLSRSWQRSHAPLPASGLRSWATATTAVLYVQLVLGAVVRHTGAWARIPDWPLSNGALIPPHFDEQIAVHFAHRTLAYVVAILVVVTAVKAIRAGASRTGIGRPAILMLVLVPVQITLGASIIWTHRQPHVTSTHVVVGALLLATSFLLTAWSWRLTGSPAAERSPSARNLLGKATA